MLEDWIRQRVDSSIRYTGAGNEIHICCLYAVKLGIVFT